MKRISVPLREFAVPSPRTGSLEARSGFGRAAVEGQEIHLRIQKKRAKTDPSYQSEVPITGSFDRCGFQFVVEGRMDGVFRSGTPKIEEIKTTFSVYDLARRLGRDPYDHPYGLQLLTYGFLWWQEHGVLPLLAFHLVSTRTRDVVDLEIALNPAQYEEWLERRLSELVVEARQAESRSARRRKIAETLPFPFPLPRTGQTELVEAVSSSLASGRSLLVQAPTGLGKTVGVLYPVLQEALARGQKVVYVTPKNSQHGVAEDAVTRFQVAGAPIRSLSVTAKGKICFKDEPVCTPEYCEFARDYYRKLATHRVLDVLAKKRKLTRRSFREAGSAYEVCPFELQFEAARFADVVICDYNYVFGPRSPFRRVYEIAVDIAGKPNLVVDEAHNLPHRGMDCYSSALAAGHLDKLRDDLSGVPELFRAEAFQLLDRCRAIISSCGSDCRGPAAIDPPVAPFLAQDLRLRTFLSRYLDSDLQIGQNDPVMRLVFSWGEFTAALELAADPSRSEFVTTFHPGREGGSVKITCCDASAMIADCYGDYNRVVAFSATLKPFDYYAKLSGFAAADVDMREIGSPFPRNRRKLLIIPQISTKYAQRERNYGRIADAVRRMVGLRPGNYFVFLPSFEFLAKVAGLFVRPQGWQVVVQGRGMRDAQIETILDHLRSGREPTVVFAVQGGSLAEGIDYCGDMAIGAFVVGPPLPMYDLERELMRDYYDRTYGAGFDYAYTIPAMAKAVQAAGRVIRSETDRGLIVLMDNRFVDPSYTRAMPADWFDVDARELVSEAILADIGAFWSALDE